MNNTKTVCMSYIHTYINLGQDGLDRKLVDGWKAYGLEC